MILAGAGIPVMAAMNASLGTRLANPALAVCLLCLLAFAIAAPLALAKGLPARETLATIPWPRFGAGTLFAFYILSITAAAPRIGVGNAVFMVLLGQLVSAALIDHFALFNAAHAPLDVRRLAGLSLIFLGAVLLRRPAD